MQQSSSLVFLHYLTTVFDNIDEAILLIGVEPRQTYRLLLANQAFARNTGRLEIPIGKPVSEAMSPEAYKILKRHYKKVVDTKQPLTITEWYEVPLGQQAYQIKLIPILSSVGECVQIAAITHNITELLELRRENKELHKRLPDDPLL